MAAVGVAAEVRLIDEDAHVGEVLWGAALEEDLKVASVVQLELGGRLWHARVKQVKGRAGDSASSISDHRTHARQLLHHTKKMSGESRLPDTCRASPYTC